VIFELGLFMGRLGRWRTFILNQSDAGTKMPSDLSGVTSATYDTTGPGPTGATDPPSGRPATASGR
jgi:predicted nucleotide-binding protein